MLRIDRFVGQSFTIDDDIVVKITGIDVEGRVGIGVTAPPSISIRRDDIKNREPRHRRHESSGGNR